jgi:PAS domain S-box-containing protein
LETKDSGLSYPFIQGGGEIGDRIRSQDWSAYGIGAAEEWPLSLRISLSNMLYSGIPMLLFWGSDYCCFYNDAFAAGIIEQLPVPGQPARDIWREEWARIKPILQKVMQTGQPITDQPLALPFHSVGEANRIDRTASLSLLSGDSGEPAGVLVNFHILSLDVFGRPAGLKSVDRFRNAMEQAPVAITLTHGEDMVIESINPTMLRVMNKTTEDNVLGKKLTEVLPELEGQPVLETVLNVLHTGQAYSGTEIPVQMLTDGVMQTRYFDLSYTPIVENGKISSVLHVALDNTKQLAMRRAIEESEAKFRTMAESTPVLIAVGNDTGRITYFNRAWTELSGKAMEELVQQDWTELLHPDDREPFVQIFGEAFAVKAPFSGEFRVWSVSGDYRWLHAHGVPRFDTHGSFAGYIAACNDVTGHKLSEQALETALEQIRLSKEAAELGTFDLDLEKGTLHWDERCRILFGISHQQPVTFDQDFSEGLHPEDRERVLKIIEASMTKAISNGDYDVDYRTVGAEDGVIRWVRAKGKVYFNSQDRPVRFIGSVLDITEQVTSIHKIESLVEERTKELALANEALIRMNKELSRSNQQLEEFAHAASHDLKEPVRKIQFFTSLLKRQLGVHLNETETGTFDRIERATERMGTLIDDLLLYSHVSERPLETEDVDLNEKVQHVLEILDLNIEEKGALIQVGDLPTVKGYSRQLQQLFQNLISNALKYSKADEVPLIQITASSTREGEQQYHFITVADNGIGFEQTYADKIFQMFSRLHGKQEYSGTGVGLSIVKKVAENHGGYIKAESVVGQGSSFMLYLPVS